jgi:hypothetical protein
MANGDELLRAHASIASLRANLPDVYEVEERWVREFNAAVDRIERAVGLTLQDFKVPQDALERPVGSSNYVTGDINYCDGLWCRREVLMHKVDAILTYFSGLQGGHEKRIGFGR